MGRLGRIGNVLLLATMIKSKNVYFKVLNDLISTVTQYFEHLWGQHAVTLNFLLIVWFPYLLLLLLILLATGSLIVSGIFQTSFQWVVGNTGTVFSMLIELKIKFN